jgi:hypothetical protein
MFARIVTAIDERDALLRKLVTATARLADLTDRHHRLATKLATQADLLMDNELSGRSLSATAPEAFTDSTASHESRHQMPWTSWIDAPETDNHHGTPLDSEPVVHNGRLIAEVVRLGPEIARVAEEAAGAQRKLEEAEARKTELLRGRG